MKSTEPTREAEQPVDEVAPEQRADAIVHLFREHNRKLVGLLVTRLKNEQEAMEVAQEAYVKLLQLEAKSGAISYLRSYLFRIAENLAIDRIRQRQIRGQIDRLEPVDDLFAEVHGERAAIAAQELEILKQAVAELPDPCRKIFTLHKLADQSIEEVAARTGLKERMVRRYIRRALVYIYLRCEGHSSADSWKVIL